MSSLRDLPEIAGLESRQGLVRIPPELDVPLTPRVQRIIDTAAFRRLAHISQLGLVPLVYPAANHTRFEHSLGVYRLALVFLQQLSRDERFGATIDAAAAERFIAAALLHDIGHWPFCHPIEDIRLGEVPSHESLAAGYLVEGEIAELLRTDWRIEPREVADLLSVERRDASTRLLSSMLSGPIDVDKMDYLQRDSLHAGVPYGRNFDQQRLIGSLCLNEAGDGLAITDKGKTAAEMMVFARYVMFSEVYWHHGVRSATAMLQRAFYESRNRLDLKHLFRLTEPAFIAELERTAGESPAADLLDGLFGSTRRLYKRLARFSLFEEPGIYRRLARRPYPWLVGCAERFSELAAAACGEAIGTQEILFDAPPVEREIEFDFEVYFRKEDFYRRLREISPVVRTLAKEQFDDYVKRVRIFAHPRVVEPLRRIANLSDLIEASINQTPSDT
ncbi:MAG TPA: HD domain-containing protein [Pirellulales bacterium]